MTSLTVAIFAIVYLGMMLSGLPLLQLDRTGIALLGAIAVVGLEILTPAQAARAVHLPTLLLLFSFMVIAAQMRLGGFYTWVAQRARALARRACAAGARTPAGAGALRSLAVRQGPCCGGGANGRVPVHRLAA